MSTSQRYVAVKLIAGKKYVLRNGRHVTVRENPHWQCRVNYPFAVIQGPDFVVYYDEEGNTGGGTAHEHDIMRPVYEEGQTYIDGDNNRVTITRVDAHTCTYPVHGDDGEEYTLDGKYLFDYVRKAHDVLPNLPLLATPVTPSRVGMRVEVHVDCATIGLGVIKYEDVDGTSAVEFDEGTEGINGLHNCSGHVPSGRGWWCSDDNMRVLDEAQAETERSEALNEVDVAEVWAAYRFNPSISIDAWLAARRQLKAAAK